ncbi:MAG TPA: glycosyltransferase [Thermomicrobiales bacterium]|nr:glycosyltransferase [Thermomicrobiales bacterium]
MLATLGSPGDLHPFLAIGAELRARGHEIIVATSALYRGQVAATSLEFAPVRPDRSPDQQDPDFLDRVIRERATPGTVFRAMFLPSLRESFEDMLGATEGADLVVAHTLASAARLTAEVRGLPWVSAVMQPMGYFSAYEPPLIGPRAISGVLHRLGPGATRPVLKLSRRLTDAWTKEWYGLRAELGLAPVKDHPLWEGQHSAIRSLGLFPRVLGEPQPDWPPQARVTGFPFYRPPHQSLDPKLRQFLEEGEPPLVFTLGTTAINDPGSFFEESAAAVKGLGYRAIFFVGHGNQQSFEDISRGAIAVSYAPHQMVFPLARAIIHQGGIGTLSEALLAGKPMLIMPYGHDQADNAWRASRLGVARVVSRRRYRGAVVVRELRRLLDDPTASVTARRVSREVARERGGQHAADLIEAALR